MTGERAVEDKDLTKVPAQRLCNEIQLFDLCERSTCSYKDGRFCTSSELLTAFEKISDTEEARPSERLDLDELDADEESYDEGYDDSFEDDESNDEAEYDDY